MNGTRESRMSKSSQRRVLKVAPTTRAIRSALAVSATVLALAGSGVAYAGTCTITALQTISCDGVFNGTVGNYRTWNLTLIGGPMRRPR